MSILRWFAREAREERCRQRMVAKEANKRNAANRSLEQVYSRLQAKPEIGLFDLLQEIHKARELCGRATDEAMRHPLLELAALDAAARVLFAENFVAIRDRTTNDPSWHPHLGWTDKPSWPEIAAKAISIVEEVKELRHAEQSKGSHTFFDALLQRAKGIQEVTTEALRNQGRDMPIWEVDQSGMSSRYPVSTLGMLAARSDRTWPTPRIRTVGDFRTALNDFPGHEWLDCLGTSVPK